MIEYAKEAQQDYEVAYQTLADYKHNIPATNLKEYNILMKSFETKIKQIKEDPTRHLKPYDNFKRDVRDQVIDFQDTGSVLASIAPDTLHLAVHVIAVSIENNYDKQSTANQLIDDLKLSPLQVKVLFEEAENFIELDSIVLDSNSQKEIG